MERFESPVLNIIDKIAKKCFEIIFCGPLVNESLKEPCDFSIEEQYKTAPVFKVKAGESLKQKLQEAKMCVGCKSFTNSKNGVGWCELHEAARLERDYPISNCFL